LFCLIFFWFVGLVWVICFVGLVDFVVVLLGFISFIGFDWLVCLFGWIGWLVGLVCCDWFCCLVSLVWLVGHWLARYVLVWFVLLV
jgi:hypothetical protein